MNNDEDSMKTIDYDSDEIENKFRYENNTTFDNGVKLNLGINAEYANYFNSSFVRNFANGEPLTLDYRSNLDVFKYGVFGQISNDFLKDRLSLSFGFRLDGNDYSETMNNPLDQFSPRFSASYLMVQDLYLNFNTGRYFQLPPYTTLGFQNSAGELVNRENGLEYIRSDHFVSGIEWRPTDQSRLTVEGFLKLYNNYPFSVRDSISISSKGADYGTFGDEEVKSIAEGRAYGFEVLYRNKDLFGGNLIVSYTYVRSQAEAFKTKALTGNNWVPASWDNRHLLNILGIKEFKNNWRLGFKWRFVGGAPYTPFDREQSSLVQAWNVRQIGILDYSRFNQLRLEEFHQLDVRVDKEIYLDKLTLNFYVDIQNLYNFKADQEKVLTIDESVSPQPVNPTAPPELQKYQLKSIDLSGGTVLPTIGIIIEF